MSEIEITDLDSGGAAVTFPIALNPGFKTAFPTARWNGAGKRWEVSTRARPRLEAWALKMAEPAWLARLEEDVHFSAAALERIEQTAAKARDRMHESEALLQQLVATHAKLQAAGAELASSGAAAATATAAADAEKARITALIDAAIDRPALNAALAVMAANHVPGDRIKKAKFEAARAAVKAQRDRLAAAGWRCRALGDAAFANVNRPDRDSVRNIPASAWFEIFAVQPEES